jgi:23S rRNA (uridine2552-2'-O)-methyltransferase
MGQRVNAGVQGIMRGLVLPDREPRRPRHSPSMATRSKSSQRWLKEHFSDPFVKKAQAEGLRSRAAYKLEELVERDRLLKPGMVVVDLGAAPGGWSQWLRQALSAQYPGNSGRVVALDILEMPGLAGVEFLHGDFRDDAVLSALEGMLGGHPADLVLSDMAPNKSGVDAVDQPRMMHLAELAMDFADRHLRSDGTFLIKLFQGVGFDDYVRELRRRYAKVVIRKPEASRKRSPEVYALALGKLAHMKQPAGS